MAVRDSELVGLPGIEPGLHPPHGRVLPVYYSPNPVRIPQATRDGTFLPYGWNERDKAAP